MAVTVHMAIVMMVMMPTVDVNASTTHVNIDSLRERWCTQDRTGQNQSK
jgi:hypothetical protein